MRRRRKFSLAGTLAWTIVLTMGSLGAAASEPDPAESAQVDQAVAFRLSYGFEADRDFVATSLHESWTFPNTEWGVPLTSDEASELRRRELIQVSMRPAIKFAVEQTGYAGAYIDHAKGGVLVFLFAGTAPHQDEIGGLLPTDVAFEVRIVERTYAQLLTVKADIVRERIALAAEGIVINGVGIHPPTNTVLVSLEALRDDAQDAMRTRFGPGLSFRSLAPREFDVCSSSSNCWPPKGGIEIIGTQPADDVECTAGWIVKRTDNSTVRQILTAGHCVSVGGGGGAPWNHNGNGIGDGQSNTWVDGNDSDVGLVGIVTGSLPSIKNQFISGSTPSPSVPVVSVVTDYYYSWEQIVGSTVCRFGITQKRDCGQIAVEDVMNESEARGTSKTIMRTWEVNFDSDGGDSGGPVYMNGAGSTKIAFGTHVHSETGYVPAHHGWYSTYVVGQLEYADVSGKYYNICLSSSC